MNDEKYLADNFSVKTLSVGQQWRPHWLTIHTTLYIYG